MASLAIVCVLKVFIEKSYILVEIYVHYMNILYICEWIGGAKWVYKGIEMIPKMCTW